MFSAVIRRVVQPSLRQARPYTHTQSVASSSSSFSSKLEKGEQEIYDKLSERFQPSELLVQDVSGGCGTFYAITIASTAFKGIPVVKQHRLVNEVLKKEIEGIHGLQVRTWFPTIHLIC
ncbi:bola-like protein [Lactarius akahatsu]|uniref:Bola-like protein n=1 Tax=Lactarius akahatsu TaxID=416441 RepID=A0AAD4Q8B3_9AGAM|nr:bola-like protein [Lactarius akahatsu]